MSLLVVTGVDLRDQYDYDINVLEYSYQTDAKLERKIGIGNSKSFVKYDDYVWMHSVVPNYLKDDVFLQFHETALPVIEAIVSSRRLMLKCLSSSCGKEGRDLIYSLNKLSGIQSKSRLPAALVKFKTEIDEEYRIAQFEYKFTPLDGSLVAINHDAFYSSWHDVPFPDGVKAVFVKLDDNDSSSFTQCEVYFRVYISQIQEAIKQLDPYTGETSIHLIQIGRGKGPGTSLQCLDYFSEQGRHVVFQVKGDPKVEEHWTTVLLGRFLLKVVRDGERDWLEPFSIKHGTLKGNPDINEFYRRPLLKLNKKFNYFIRPDLSYYYSVVAFKPDKIGYYDEETVKQWSRELLGWAKEKRSRHAWYFKTDAICVIVISAAFALRYVFQDSPSDRTITLKDNTVFSIQSTLVATKMQMTKWFPVRAHDEHSHQNLLSASYDSCNDLGVLPVHMDVTEVKEWLATTPEDALEQMQKRGADYLVETQKALFKKIK